MKTIAIIALAAVMGLTACGGSDSDRSAIEPQTVTVGPTTEVVEREPSPEQEVADVTNSFADALVDERYDEACKLLASETTDRMQSEGGCAKVMADVAKSEGWSDEGDNLPTRITADNVTIEGSKATVLRKDSKNPLNLIQQGGRWFIHEKPAVFEGDVGANLTKGITEAFQKSLDEDGNGAKIKSLECLAKSTTDGKCFGEVEEDGQVTDVSITVLIDANTGRYHWEVD